MKMAAVKNMGVLQELTVTSPSTTLSNEFQGNLILKSLAAKDDENVYRDTFSEKNKHVWIPSPIGLEPT